MDLAKKNSQKDLSARYLFWTRDARSERAADTIAIPNMSEGL